MTKSLSLRSLAGAAAIAVAAGGAHAVTISSFTNFDDPGFAYPSLTETTSITGTWADAPSVRAGNLNGIYRTPFDETPNAQVENATFDNAVVADVEYFAVGPGNPANPAILEFANVQQSFSFLWGSPDSFNELTFKLDGAEVGVFTGTVITGAPSAGSVWAEFEGRFDEVQFYSSPSNAFEFASIETTAVPLPAGAVLLLTALGGFAVARRRSKAA